MNQIQYKLTAPPKSWLKLMLRLKVAIAVAILITTLGLSGCTKPNLTIVGTPFQWQDAEKVMPQEMLQSIVQQVTSTLSFSKSSIPIQTARLQGKQEVVFLNFARFPELCGDLGCLVVAYLAQNDQSPIWNIYAAPNLPKHVPLLAQFDARSMPSFVVNQLDGTRIRQILYTWDGSTYQPERNGLN